MVCNEQASGFVKPDDILMTNQFTDFSPVSSREYNLLVRAKRHGRWWLLKGLKEPYRQDAVYQVLLQKEYEITSQLQHPMVVSAFSFEEVVADIIDAMSTDILEILKRKDNLQYSSSHREEEH